LIKKNPKAKKYFMMHVKQTVNIFNGIYCIVDADEEV
jgi:hypothetical protein